VKKTQDYPLGCDQAIRQIQNQVRVKIGTDLSGRAEFSDDRDDRVPDHAYDCIR
jgi:hypothetical protein